MSRTRIAGPATVVRTEPTSRGTRYVVTGVHESMHPTFKPVHAMEIAHERGEPWRLIINGKQHSLHRTLRQARYEASRYELANPEPPSKE